jgi:hypothetical protein
MVAVSFFADEEIIIIFVDYNTKTLWQRNQKETAHYPLG